MVAFYSLICVEILFFIFLFLGL